MISTKVDKIFQKTSYTIEIEYFSSFYIDNQVQYSKLSVTLDGACLFDFALSSPIEKYINSEDAFYGFTASYDKSYYSIKFHNPQLFVSKIYCFFIKIKLIFKGKLVI